MERKKLWKRGLSFGLSIIMILLICLSPLPQGLFKLEVNAAESTYALSKSELALGMCVIPNSLWNDKGFMSSNVLNGKMDITDYFKDKINGNFNSMYDKTIRANKKDSNYSFLRDFVIVAFWLLNLMAFSIRFFHT